MRLLPIKLLILIAALSAGVTVTISQTKKNAGKRPVAKATPAAEPTPDNTADTKEPAKRNARSADQPAAAPPTVKIVPVYFYVFTRPGFTYSRIEIEHDEAGKGTISFQKSSFDEPIVDPIDLSAKTMANINEAVTALDFLASTEEYQYARDYSHLGNVEFRMKQNGRERTVKYNWTDNKHAKALMDEYRRISNEYTWRFEILLARDNQPLFTPGLVETMESYLKRNEISDPAHLVPFLTELSNDERLPLMGRNLASKLIKDIKRQNR